VSQYIGDLENLETFRFFEHTINKMKRIIKVNPTIIAYDLHPDYLSTKYAQEIEGYERRIPIQHHHAHIASCMAENGLHEKAIGLAWDGTGFGEDGCVWGGEFLVADYASFTRKAFFSYIPMPGGAKAIQEPYRMAMSYLFKLYGEKAIDVKLPFIQQVDPSKLYAIMEILKKGINCPLTSSAGRLFESLASIVGIRRKNTFEGQAAIELEYFASSMKLEENPLVYPYEIIQKSDHYEINVLPMIQRIVEDTIDRHYSSARIAFFFHLTMATVALDICLKIRNEKGLNKVVLSGGVFQNRLLTSLLTKKLQEHQFTPYVHRKIPANDGGISLGQVVIAQHKNSD